MDNQQETKWLAAIIDGEGSFRKTKKSGCNVRISNTEIDLIEKCEKILKQNMVVFSTSNWKRKDKKREYEISIHSLNDCSILFKLVENHLCRINELASIIGSSETTREIPSDMNWLGGILEAEGSFHICKREHKGTFSFAPEIGLTNTRISIIDKAIKTLYNNGFSWHVGHFIPTNQKHKEYDNITIRGYLRVKKALNKIEPYLLCKRAKLKHKLLNEFCSSRLLMNIKEPYTTRQKQIYQILREMI